VTFYDIGTYGNHTKPKGRQGSPVSHAAAGGCCHHRHALQELERELEEGETDKLLQRLRQYLSERRKKLAS